MCRHFIVGESHNPFIPYANGLWISFIACSCSRTNRSLNFPRATPIISVGSKFSCKIMTNLTVHKALVALNHFCYAVFEMVFAQACQLAKSIGLHQQNMILLTPTLSGETCSGSYLLSTNNYLLFVAKLPPSYVWLRCSTARAWPGYPLFDHFLANIRMAYLQEDIYRSLYSAEAGRITESQRQQNVEDILGKLKVWSAAYQHLDVPISPDNSCQKPYFGLELKYALLTSRILVQRRSKERKPSNSD